jgi:hypothetical protein
LCRSVSTASNSTKLKKTWPKTHRSSQKLKNDYRKVANKNRLETESINNFKYLHWTRIIFFGDCCLSFTEFDPHLSNMKYMNRFSWMMWTTHLSYNYLQKWWMISLYTNTENRVSISDIDGRILLGGWKGIK